MRFSVENAEKQEVADGQKQTDTMEVMLHVLLLYNFFFPSE